MNVIYSIAHYPLLSCLPSVKPRDEDVGHRHRWERLLQRVGNTSRFLKQALTASRVKMDDAEWKTEGIALQRNAQIQREIYASDTLFLHKPRKKGLVIQALVGLSIQFLPRQLPVVPFSYIPNTSLEPGCRHVRVEPVGAASTWRHFWGEIAGITHSFLSHIDRSLRFPVAAAEEMPNRKNMTDDDYYSKVKYANIDSEAFFSDIFGEVLFARNKVVGNFLNTKGYLNDEDEYRYSSMEIVIAAIRFINEKKNGEKLLATRLLRHAGLYGGWDNEPVSDVIRQEEIRRWINDNIFGDALDTFFIDEMVKDENSPSWNVKSLYHVVLKQFNHFFSNENKDIKTSDAIDWAWKHVVLHQLPILRFIDSKRVMALELKKFSWGEIYAGLLWLQSITHSTENISPDEASSVGCFLLAGIKSGTLPYAWVNFFSLPAAIFIAITGDENDDNEENALTFYFEARETYVNQTYPLEMLVNLINGYKKRSQFDYSTSLFIEQNTKIADCYAKVDQFIISAAFTQLATADYNFIYASSIKKIDAEFNWVKPWYNFGMMPEEASIIQNQQSIKLSSAVDLLAVDNGVEERIYAYFYHQGNVQFKRVDNRDDYYILFNDKRPQLDEGYELTIHPGGQHIKHQHETIHIAIANMVNVHREKIKSQLFNYGNEKSIGEIITDVALSLIPFYTCINESIQGNVVLAVQACMMDGLIFAIPSAQATLMATRMAEFLGIEALMAVRYMVSRLALEITVKNAAKLGMKHFLYYGIYGTEQHMGWQQIVLLARTIDPGFELCFLIGRNGVREALRLGHMLYNIMPALKKGLRNITDNILIVLPKGSTSTQVNTFIHANSIPLKKIGFDISSSYEIYVPFSTTTGEIYGNKYYRLSDGTFRLVPSSTKHELINLNMLVHGLGGGGAPHQGQIWASERQQDDTQRVTPAPSPSSSGHHVALKSVDASLLSEILQMDLSEFLLTGGRDAVAQAYHVSSTELAIYIDDARRLTPAGEKLLAQSDVGTSETRSDRKPPARRVQNGNQSRYLLDKWLRMSKQEQTKIGGIKGFAQQNNIAWKKFKGYLRKDGTLNQIGVQLMTNAQYDAVGMSKVDTYRKRLFRYKIRRNGERHRQLLITWSLMTDAERNEAGGIISFARQHQVDAKNLKTYLTKSGKLTINGQILIGMKDVALYSNPAARKHLIRGRYNGAAHRRVLTLWNSMTPDARQAAGGIAQFAASHQVDAARLRQYLYSDESLNVTGLNLIHRTIARKFASKGASASATAHQPATVPPTLNRENENRRDEAIEQSGTPFPAVTIKDEPMDVEPPAPRHQIDDNLPILQHPDDNTLSVLVQAEGNIDALKVTHWNELLDVFAGMPRHEQAVVKKNILASAQAWLRTEGHHRSAFQALVYPAQDLAEGPERGMSIFARQPIAKFQVVGPYSGVLHASIESLHREMERVGAANVNTYLWETRSSRRVVSGFGHGNTLSLINTGQLPGHALWRENNLTAIRVGKNLIFYVAMRDIAQDEELLVSYGESFNPAGTR